MGLASGHPVVRAKGPERPAAKAAAPEVDRARLSIGLANLAEYLDAEVERWSGPGFKSEEFRQRRLAELQGYVATVKEAREALRA